MVSSSQIRNELAFVVAGILPLDDFEDWFVQNTWNVHNTGSKAAEVLTFAIEEALSEYTSGHISESKLRQELESVLQSETSVADIVRVMQPQPVFLFRSASPFVRAALPVQL